MKDRGRGNGVRRGRGRALVTHKLTSKWRFSDRGRPSFLYSPECGCHTTPLTPPDFGKGRIWPRAALGARPSPRKSHSTVRLAHPEVSLTDGDSGSCHFRRVNHAAFLMFRRVGTLGTAVTRRTVTAVAAGLQRGCAGTTGELQVPHREGRAAGDSLNSCTCACRWRTFHHIGIVSLRVHYAIHANTPLGVS